MTHRSLPSVRPAAESAPAALFPAGWLARFHYLALRAERVGVSPLFAKRPRKLPAGGTEATGVRDYCPGDDLRYVDWHLCARRDEVMTRTFEGTGDLHVSVLLDVSRSMGVDSADAGRHGSPAGAKFKLARQMAAACGCWALENLAAFSLVTFSGGLGPALRRLRGRWRLVQVLRFLEPLQPDAAPTDLAAAAAAFVRLPQPRGPVVVISDLLDRAGFVTGLDMLRYHGFAAAVVHLYAAEDAEPPRLGDVELVDCETGSRQLATVTERAAARYRQRFARFLEQVEDYCTRRTLPWVRLRADVAEERALRAILGLPDGGVRSSHVAKTPAFGP